MKVYGRRSGLTENFGSKQAHASESVTDPVQCSRLKEEIHPMDVQLTPDQQTRLSRMAAQQGRAEQALVQEAVERLLGYEEWFSPEVDKGLAAADAGEFVEHDEIRRMIESRVRPNARSLDEARFRRSRAYLRSHRGKFRNRASPQSRPSHLRWRAFAGATMPFRGRRSRKPGTRELVISGLPFSYHLPRRQRSS